MSEAQLQDAIVELAGMLGYMVAHFRPAKTEKGWRTAGSYDAAGFPDLVLAGRSRVLFIECKSDRGRVSMEQAEWMDQLEWTPGEVYLWRPEHWNSGEVERILKGVVSE